MKQSKEQTDLFNFVYSSLMESPGQWKWELWQGRPYVINREIQMCVGDRMDKRRDSDEKHSDVAIHILDESGQSVAGRLYKRSIFPWKGREAAKLLDAIKTLEDRQSNKVINDTIIRLRSPLALAREALNRRAGK